MSEWEWAPTDNARRDLDRLDDYAKERISIKLNEVVTDEWRDPPEYDESREELKPDANERAEAPDFEALTPSEKLVREGVIERFTRCCLHLKVGELAVRKHMRIDH